MTTPDTQLRQAVVQPRAWRGVRSSDDWRTSLLLLLALLVTIPGLHTILVGTMWVVQLGLVCVLVLGAAAVTRSLSRITFLPPVVGALAFVAAITAVFAPSTAFLAVIPTTDTFAAFNLILQQAATSIAVQALPANADTAITFLMCIGVASIALVADIAAIALRAPALVGIPLVVLLAVPAYIEPGNTDPITFVLAIIAYLLLLRVGSRQGQGTLSVGLGSAIVVLSLIVSFVLPTAGDSTSGQAGGSFGTGVNPVLSLGKDLRQSANRAVLSYTTKSGGSQYLRLVSVVDFNGSDWAPETYAVNRKNSVDAIASAPGLTQAIMVKKDTTTVQVEGLTSKWLPLPYPSTKVTGLDGPWYWDSVGHAVSSPGRTVSGQTYSVSDLELEPTPAQLLAAGTTVPAGLDRYLAVPKNLPAIVAATAKEVVGTAPTNYEKALLLQAYFHDGDFTYSETAPLDNGYDGTGGQVIAKFLKVKAGYCIHFASAMAVMARTLGIPSRISVGFLPGQPHLAGKGETSYEVASHDLHAWPELYFAGIGWTRFEPTVSRGDLPSYANSADPGVPVASASNNPVPSTSAAPVTAPTARPRPLLTDGPGPARSSTATTGGGSWLWSVVALLVIVLAVLVPGVIRAVQRRRRILALRNGPVLTGWREVLQSSADVGLPIPDTLTPRDAAAAMKLGESPALERLVAALEHERFARDSLPYPGAADDTRQVIAKLYADTPPRDRLRAVLFPPSLWRWLLRR